MATSVVKWDSKGNPITSGSAKPKKRLMRFSFGRLAKEDAGPIVGGVVGGALAVGIGSGLVSIIPPLRRWATSGSALTRGLVIGGTSLVVGGLGLAAYAKMSGAKKAMAAGLPVLGSIVVLVAGPAISMFIIEKIDNLIAGFTSQTPVTPTAQLPSSTGAGPVPRMRQRRRALTPDEVLAAEPTRGRRSGGAGMW